MTHTRWALACPHGHRTVTPRVKKGGYRCKSCRRIDTYDTHIYPEDKITDLTA